VAADLDLTADAATLDFFISPYKMHILIIYFLWIEEILAAIMGACGNIGEV
jgi:hypothetical protein